MCEEIIERTLGGSPIARAAAVGNLTQELQIIKNSMEDAADMDVTATAGSMQRIGGSLTLPLMPLPTPLKRL
jgi:hypothetical protein